jgi:DNA polymerase I
MKLNFFLLDCDYFLLNNEPIIRIFGKDEKGEAVCLLFRNFYPYFYVLPKKGKEEDVIEFLKKSFSNLIFTLKYEEKFLPIGYREKKTKLIKVYLKDPSKVPRLREALHANENVRETFEADIMFKYRFMADFDLKSFHWYEANVSKVSTNISKIKTYEVFDFKEIKKDDLPEFKYLAIDIEIASKTGIPDAKRDPIIMISLAFNQSYKGEKDLVLVAKPSSNSKASLFFKNEKEMLETFLKIVEEYDPDFIVGYNINEFDLPYIFQRLKINKIQPLLGRVTNKKAFSAENGNKTKNKIPGRIVIDVYEIVKDLTVKGGLLRLKRYGLGDVANELINETKEDVAHSEIYKLWNGSREDLERLIKYARKDAIIALRLLLEKQLLFKYIGISKVSGLLLQDILDYGESMRVEFLLLKEFNKRGFVIPNKPSEKEIAKREKEREVKGLKGALVLEPEVGLHSNVIYLDFKSMYPTIFINFNICPTTLVLDEKIKDVIETPYGTKFVSKNIREGIIPQILSRLINERDKVKKLMKEEKDENKRLMLDARQWGLKYMANAFYGYTGYVRARFYILDIANAITSCGRTIISETKKIIEDANPNYKVIYGDTDSVMVKIKNVENIEKAFELGERIVEHVNEKMKGKAIIKIESVFKSLLILSKKRYAGLALEKDGYKEKMIMKGIETVRRDWCSLTSEVLTNVLNILLREESAKEKVFDYVKDVLIKLEQNKIPIEKLAITKSITKPIHEYKGIQPHIELIKKMRKRGDPVPGVGDRISYVIIAGPQLVSHRAEDPTYVKKHNLKIDSRYYIENQLLPPLERVFEVIGVSKTQLIGLGKQTLLNGKFSKKEVSDYLEDFDGFVCKNCNKFYEKVPLLGKCLDCNGELLFYNQKVDRSAYFLRL